MELIGFAIRRWFTAKFHCLPCVDKLSDEHGWDYKIGGARKASYAVVRDSLGTTSRVGAGGTLDPNKMARLQLDDSTLYMIIFKFALYHGLRLPVAVAAPLNSMARCGICGVRMADAPIHPRD